MSTETKYEDFIAEDSKMLKLTNPKYVCSNHGVTEDTTTVFINIKNDRFEIPICAQCIKEFIEKHFTPLTEFKEKDTQVVVN